MSAHSPKTIDCRVIGEAKSVASTGGADSICMEMRRAVSARAPGARYEIEVRVISSSRLAAAITVNGRALPVHNFAVMDGHLSAESIKHFAASVAAAVADASKR